MLGGTRQIAGEAQRSRLPLQTAASELVDFSRRKPLGAIGEGILAVLIIIAVLAPVISPFDPEEIHSEHLFAPPGGFLPLGGDSVGRDVMSRLFYGGRISLRWSCQCRYRDNSRLAVGSHQRLSGREVRHCRAAVRGRIHRLPWNNSSTGDHGRLRIIGNQHYYRLGTGPGAKRHPHRPFPSVGDTRIVLRHMVPNCMALYIVLVTIHLGGAIITEASLSFLGIGAPPDVPSWGGMLRGAAQNYVEVAPWLGVFPGLAISIVVFAWNLLGDALRDVLDPRLRGTGRGGA